MWLTGRLAPEVERMNRTLREATVRRYHCDSHDQLWQHLGPFPLRLQLRQAPQDIEGAHALRSHLRGSDEEARLLQARPYPAHPRDYTNNVRIEFIQRNDRWCLRARGPWRDGRKQKIFFPDFHDLEVGTAELQPACCSCLRLLQAIDTA